MSAPIDERLAALALSVELLARSASDLRAVVEAQLVRERERRESDTKFIALIADVLKQWGTNGKE
jgi:hypothetical protein